MTFANTRMRTSRLVTKAMLEVMLKRSRFLLYSFSMNWESYLTENFVHQCSIPKAGSLGRKISLKKKVSRPKI